LEGTIILSNAPQSQLERNRLIQERWYDLFVQRIHLLIPKAERVDTDTLQPDDVVLFVFQDPGIPKMWVWRLGIIVSQVSRSTYEIRYVSQVGSPPRTIMRDARHILLIHKADEIPPMSSRFLENRMNMPAWAIPQHQTCQESDPLGSSPYGHGSYMGQNGSGMWATP